MANFTRMAAVAGASMASVHPMAAISTIAAQPAGSMAGRVAECRTGVVGIGAVRIRTAHPPIVGSTAAVATRQHEGG